MLLTLAIAGLFISAPSAEPITTYVASDVYFSDGGKHTKVVDCWNGSGDTRGNRALSGGYQYSVDGDQPSKFEIYYAPTEDGYDYRVTFDIQWADGTSGEITVHAYAICTDSNLN